LHHVLESTYLISIIRQEGKVSEKTKGYKIFLSDVTTYSALQGQIGNQREAFFCMHMQILDKEVSACKQEEIADFVVDRVTFEIGGPSKYKKKADLVLSDKSDDFQKNFRPLWSLGFVG
jgi:predicted AAA+ superfamily ATPase